MNDIIRLLPDSVANQIAAGEVIQRPAAVIKELVENSVDAGATDIRIYIKDAGKTLIQVVDNGCGMSPVDARMAFERHATSKISRADDIFKLHTMGFRGEALPSICAISQVELRTRRDSDAMGTRLVINQTEVQTQEPDMCEKGTSISVKNIYYNTPVRRKFLKSDYVELSNIMREFERMALVNNHIHLSIDTGVRTLDLRPASFHQRIHDIWKNNLKMQLLPVEVDTQLIKVHGFISRPEFARRRNALQFLIVNGRNMRHPYFHKAILSCFDGLIAADTQPCYFLKFEVDPATIDVNIHPAKSEIKFEYESEIWPLLVAGVKASLGKNAAVPSIDFNADVVPVKPHEEDDPIPVIDLPPDYNPFAVNNDVDFQFNDFNYQMGGSGDFKHSSPASASRYRENPNVKDWEKLYSDFMVKSREEIPEDYHDSQPLPGLETDITVQTQLCIQFALKYILTTVRDAVLIIDQHRAHVKILYERYLDSVKGESMVAQRVMFPELLHLEPEQRIALAEIQNDLKLLGFELDKEDEESFRITSVPADLHGTDAKDVILRILDSVCEDSQNYGADQRPAESMLSNMALILARSSAITRGYRLTSEEMEQIVTDLFSLPDPSFTPNGNRIYARLDESSLFRLLQ